MPIPEGIEIVEIPNQGKCDFCNCDSPQWRYKCRSFQVDAVMWRSVEDWAACEECHQAIERAIKDGRVMAMISSIVPRIEKISGKIPVFARDQVISMLGVTWSAFLVNRIADAMRDTESFKKGGEQDVNKP